MMGGPDLTDIEEFLVISDLQMGRGPDLVSGTPDPDDAFHRDDQLVALLDHTALRADRDRVCVVVLGDMLDLLLVEPSFRLQPDARTSTTLRRLDQVAAGHYEVIRAFGRCARAGVRLVIVPGDRDVELVREATRHRLATLMVPGPDDAAIAGRARIGFSSWALHVPGVLYAEHGSQFRDVDAFDAFAAPWVNGDVERVRRPVGAMVTLFAAARAASLRGQRVGRLGALPSAAAVATALARQWDPRRASRRRAYRTGPVREIAAAGAMPVAVAQECDRLGEHRAGAIERRVVGDVIRSRVGRPATGGSPGSLRRAARTIHALLAASGHPVAYVVMGHTHVIDHVELPRGGAYLNTGCWATAPGVGPGAGSVAGMVVIRVDHAAKTCSASIGGWPDEARSTHDGAGV